MHARLQDGVRERHELLETAERQLNAYAEKVCILITHTHTHTPRIVLEVPPEHHTYMCIYLYIVYVYAHVHKLSVVNSERVQKRAFQSTVILRKGTHSMVRSHHHYYHDHDHQPVHSNYM